MPDGRSNLPERGPEMLALLRPAGRGGMPVSAIAQRSGLSVRRAQQIVARLLELGLVLRSSPKGPVSLTAAGAGIAARAELGPAAGDGPAGLRAVLERFPSEEHRAYLRLGLSMILAKFHLGTLHAEGWGGLVAVGGTAELKTTAARTLARLVGLEPAAAVMLASDRTPADLIGRRVQRPGGAWAVDPSPSTALPFYALDEADKAPRSLRATVLRALQGDAAVRIGDELVDSGPWSCSRRTSSAGRTSGRSCRRATSVERSRSCERPGSPIARQRSPRPGPSAEPMRFPRSSSPSSGPRSPTSRTRSPIVRGSIPGRVPRR